MKTKIVVVIGLALCTMLLVSPALASDAGTLEIYGNANEDDTIDMRDLTYVKLIFFDKKPETKLADAKYDGKINPLDFIQIKLIIVGKEKEITIVDAADRIVTVNMPIERMVVFTYSVAEGIKIVKADDKVVGISSDIKRRKTFFPELRKLPSAGVARNPDTEKILELNPDIVCTGRLKSLGNDLEDKLPNTIAVTCWDMERLDVMTKNIKMLGFLLDRRVEAEQFGNFYQEYIDETIGERVSEILDSNKQRLYFESPEDYNAFTIGHAGHEQCVAAGV